MGLERLEERELLAYTPLGYSLPDLTVSGTTSSVAAWGGSLSGTLNVQNLGASTLIEPTMLQPGASSHADAAATTVAVILSSRPHPNGGVSLQVGSISVPSILQNDLKHIPFTIPSLPSRPAGFPGDGGKVYVSFVVNPTNNVTESDTTNNTSRSQPVRIKALSPNVVVSRLDVPPVMQPGDTIQPNIVLTNIGTATSDTEGPLQVMLVASVERRSTPGQSIIQLIYTVANIDPHSSIAINGTPVALPPSPDVYYIGVVINPDHSTKKLHVIQKVGPPIKDLPPAGVIFAGGGTSNFPFPFPPNVSPTVATFPQTGIKTT